MFAVYGKNTMAGAKRIVHDTAQDRPRRQSLRELSLKWIAEQERKKREALADDLQREREQTEQPAALDLALAAHSTTPARELISRVAVWHGYDFRAIVGAGRARSLVTARWDCIAAVYTNCSIRGRRYSLLDMARLFRRDHTSILNALQKRGLR